MKNDNEERKRRCAEAMRAHGDAVYRLAFARCRNTADAEDIFQTTFLRFYASRTLFKNAEHEKAWLLRVCINACKDLQKSAWHMKVSAMPDEFDVPDMNTRIEVPGKTREASSPDRSPSNAASGPSRKSAHFNTDSLLEGGSNE